ncbi:hypothetical protein C2869_09840 [Saccharobesus litoralis]|uniref:Type III pantothenate kinase n=1 Tax=Saccharobesus litoralis TaxID=2172099 RepID=A0A2S0VR90_9ALTE|nr:type III pantothenate kinase [Saccharobesus litoralis]AWB66714.1 hypothetical protein C2869_09840 [Saccharobesus litoralis]
MTILLVDEGNTRIKYAELDTNSGFIKLLDSHLLSKANLNTQNYLAIYASSVKSGAELQKMLATQFSCPIYIIETPDSKYGLTIAYADKTRLGVDRWLAMLGAFCNTVDLAGKATGEVAQNTKYCAQLVADFGTAVTIDAIEQDGTHIGGWIIPGLNTAKSGLLGKTASIKIKTDVCHKAEFGDMTESCVNNGIYVSILSTIFYACKLLLKKAETIDIYLTGGDCELFYAELVTQLNEQNINIYQVDDLVFKGLAQYAELNAQ